MEANRQCPSSEKRGHARFAPLLQMQALRCVINSTYWQNDVGIICSQHPRTNFKQAISKNILPPPPTDTSDIFSLEMMPVQTTTELKWAVMSIFFSWKLGVFNGDNFVFLRRQLAGIQKQWWRLPATLKWNMHRIVFTIKPITPNVNWHRIRKIEQTLSLIWLCNTCSSVHQQNKNKSTSHHLPWQDQRREKLHLDKGPTSLNREAQQ